jgi:hypothetical protein
MDEYQSYYKVYRKNGNGYLLRAFNELEAIAKLKHLERITDKYFCVWMLQPKTYKGIRSRTDG